MVNIANCEFSTELLSDHGSVSRAMQSLGSPHETGSRSCLLDGGLCRQATVRCGTVYIGRTPAAAGSLPT